MILIHQKRMSFIIAETVQDGQVIDNKDFYSKVQAKKYYTAKYGPEGDKWKWVDQPWTDANIKEAQENYLNVYGVTYTGREKI
jgi:hypothetical protein